MSATPFIFLNVAASATALMVAVMAWRRRRIPGGRPLSALMAAVAIWAAGAAVELGSTGVEAKLLWAQLQYVGTVSVPVLFLLFVLEFNRMKKWVNGRTVLLLSIVPAVTLLLAASNSRHGLVWSSLTPDPSGADLVVYGHGPWFWIGGVGYSYLLAAVATLLLVRAAVRYHKVFHRQAAAVLAGAACPWLASLVYNLGWIPLPGLDPTPMAFSVSGLISAFAIFRLGLLDLVPLARRLMVDNLEDGVVVLDASNRLIDLNPAACRLLGLGPEAVRLGQPLERLPSKRPEVLQSLLAAAGRHFEITRHRRCLEVAVSHLEEGPELFYGRLVVLRDVTERRQAERERLEMERRLLQSQKTESIGVLAGGIAHDYNNLLTVIQGGLELTLLDLPPDSELRTPLERAVRAADRAAVLTRQILDYSGRGRTVLTDVDLSGIVADKVPLLRASIAKTIELDLQLAAGLPRVRADAAQVQQLVVNLVINAAEAIGERVGTIIVSSGVCTCDAAQLSASRTPAAPAPGRFAFLSVTDNGGGMSDEIQGRAFDPFFTTKSTGRGLGLSSVLGIVHGCGGAVFLDSLPARGTAVRALFPLEERPDAVVAAPAEPPAAPASRPPALRGRGRLLLVDDEDMVRDVCQSMLARMGFEVLTAADGMEAVEIYRRHAAEIDGVVLDYAMPRMDGLATLRAMAGIRADVRAILSSGYTEEEATRRFNDAGLAGFIQKPYQFEKLRAAVLGVLGSTTGG